MTWDDNARRRLAAAGAALLVLLAAVLARPGGPAPAGCPGGRYWQNARPGRSAGSFRAVGGFAVTGGETTLWQADPAWRVTGALTATWTPTGPTSSRCWSGGVGSTAQAGRSGAKRTRPAGSIPSTSFSTTGSRTACSRSGCQVGLTRRLQPGRLRTTEPSPSALPAGRTPAGPGAAGGSNASTRRRERCELKVQSFLPPPAFYGGFPRIFCYVLRKFSQTSEYKKLSLALSGAGACALFGLPAAGRALVYAALHRSPGQTALHRHPRRGRGHPVCGRPQHPRGWRLPCSPRGTICCARSRAPTVSMSTAGWPCSAIWPAVG